MITITETIHHGNYRSTRIMQVTTINQITVKALLTSSPYCYTHPSESALVGIVRDLQSTGKAEFGWSDFTLEAGE